MRPRPTTITSTRSGTPASSSAVIWPVCPRRRAAQTVSRGCPPAVRLPGSLPVSLQRGRGVSTLTPSTSAAAAMRSQGPLGGARGGRSIVCVSAPSPDSLEILLIYPASETTLPMPVVGRRSGADRAALPTVSSAASMKHLEGGEVVVDTAIHPVAHGVGLALPGGGVVLELVGDLRLCRRRASRSAPRRSRVRRRRATSPSRRARARRRRHPTRRCRPRPPPPSATGRPVPGSRSRPSP